MKILLLGHEGYLGRSLFAFLGRRHEMYGWDQKENIFNLDAAYLSRTGIEVVINMAMIPDRSSGVYQVGAPCDEVNVMGARHLAKILKGTDISWFQISTREVFGNAVYGPKDVIKTKAGYRPKFLLDEGFRYAPINFYGKTKLMAEFISESHPRSNIIRLTTCYTDFNFPGGNWVVQLIRAAVEGRPIPLTRNGLQFRDPLHVDDLGRLIESLIERKIFSEIIHAGGGEKNILSLREFARIAAPKGKIERRPGGDYGVAFDIRKAFRLTGWKPKILVRERIPVIAENIRRGIDRPLPATNAAAV
ncbi:MAG: NAD-dependent epimerase/dehydratase family protein [Elusimicrobiota bacterium]